MEKRILSYFFALIFVMSSALAQEKIVNGNFEAQDISMWIWQNGGTGAATMERSTVNPISGTASLHVTITTAGTAGYHIQLCELFGVLDQKRYVIKFNVRASAPVTITSYMQQNHDPYGTITQKSVNVLTTTTAFVDSVDNTVIKTDSSAKLSIWMGTLPVGTELWFDDVTIIEKVAPPPPAPAQALKTPGVEMLQNGSFEGASINPWKTQVQAGGAMTAALTTTSPLQATQSMLLSVTAAGTVDYAVQAFQAFKVTKGKRYFTSIKFRPTANVIIKHGVQQAGSPYGFLSPFKADTLKKDSTYTLIDTTGYMAADDNVNYTIFLGNTGVFNAVVDFASVIENDMGDVLPIKIDGIRDGFYNSLTNPNDGKIFFPAASYLRDIGTAPTQNPGSNNNLSAILWSAWDRNYLYFYAEVHDDIVLDNNATNWSNDKIELKINPDPTVKSTSGALQVGLSALGVDDVQDPGALDNMSADGDLYFNTGVKWNQVVSPADYARRTLPNGYVIEWRIPLATIRNSTGAQNLYPGVGGKFGIAVNVADNDATERTRMLQWSAGRADDAWSNPAKHGNLTFLTGNKLKWQAYSLQDSATYHCDSAQAWYFGLLGPVTGVKAAGSVLPGSYALGQNYPNPFNPSTTIKFSVPERSNVKIALVNMLGQVVKEVVAGDYAAGSYEVNVNAGDLASGVYFYRLQAGSFVDVKKMVLMK
jgi:hypothetical protein